MIGKLTGILDEIDLTKIIIDINGVGYRVFIPMSTYDKLSDVGKTISLQIYTNVREDAIHLYGFATKEEKGLFELLISVSGIGTKVALNILSSMSVYIFCQAVTGGDFKSVTRINGIGKKTAERLILELKDKIRKLAPELIYTPESKEFANAEVLEDAILALEQLGFKREGAVKAVKKIASTLPENEISSENLIRKALSDLNK